MKQRIKLTESDIHNLVKESLKIMLTESQESKSQSEAIKLVMNKFGWDKERANQFVRVELRNDIPALRDKQLAKFTLGVTRMYIQGQLRDASTISKLNATLELLKAHLDEYDRNLQPLGNSNAHPLSAQELIAQFEQVMQNNLEAERQKINSMTFGESHYTIVPINTFEEAKKYYKYTYQQSPWCLTHMEGMFNSYTCNGMNQLYFCLRNGFETEEPIVGEGAPLDDYGLSMISVIVNEDGGLAYCTTRWNHSNGGNDKSMDVTQLSKVLNVNFFNVFKPNNKWKELLQSVQQRLANGENPHKIFNYVGYFHEGFTVVKLNNKMNFLKQDGGLLTDQWFDWAEDFHEGFAVVTLRGRGLNFIKRDGTLLTDQWFDVAYRFREGFAVVKLEGRGYNYLKPDGTYLTDQWFDEVYNFQEGFAVVKLEGRGDYLIDRNGVLYDMVTGEPVTFTNESRLNRIIQDITRNVLNEMYTYKKFR